MRRYTEKFINKLIDKSLEQYGVTLEDVYKNAKPKDKPYYQVYTWKKEEDYQKWKEYCIEEISKVHKDFDSEKLEEEFNIIDGLGGLCQPYLFEPFRENIGLFKNVSGSEGVGAA